MREFGVYGLWSSVVALAALVVLLLFAFSRGETVIGWSLLGWMVMTVTGVIGGSWMAALHGRPGSAFIGAVLGCMLARLVGSALGAWAATPTGIEAARPYVLGLGFGYVPLQVFEAKWFLNGASVARKSRAAMDESKEPRR